MAASGNGCGQGCAAPVTHWRGRLARGHHQDGASTLAGRVRDEGERQRVSSKGRAEWVVCAMRCGYGPVDLASGSEKAHRGRPYSLIVRDG